MALTGLFLCLFLVGHLVGNLQLFIPGEAGRLQFNEYAKFMTTNPAVKLLSYVTYLSIILHVVYSILLTRYNQKARKINYAVNKGSQNSSLSSRNMGVLGVLVLVFIIIHLKGFWYEMHWGEIGKDSAGNRNLYDVVVRAFQEWWYVLLYVVSMAVVGFHLFHGFSSAFQTLGLGQQKYFPIIKKIGYAFAIIVPTLFASIPIYLFLK